jgi:uncharacterized protein YukE
MSGTAARSVRRAWTASSVLAVFLVAAACAPPPPVEHVQLYADTAQQTRTAGGLVLDRIAPIVAAQDNAQPAKDCGPDGQSGIPRCFDLLRISGNGAGRSDPPSIAVQRTALDLVAAYSRILADLAEGKSSADLQSDIGIAAAVAGTLVTLTGVGAPIGAALPLLVPQIQAMAGRLEAQRAGQVVRQSLIADRETIQAVLKALEDSTPQMYDIYKAKRQLDRLAALEARDRPAATAAVDDIKKFYAALEAYVRLLRTTSATLDTLANDAQQPVKVTAQSVQGTLNRAIEARAEALMLLNTVRQLDGPRP